MQRHLGFDLAKDLTSVALVAASANLTVISPSLKSRTLKEVIEDAKGGDDNYGTAGAGITPHLSAEYIFKVPATHTRSSGATPALNATMGAQTQLPCIALPVAIELVKAGRVRGLVVTCARRSPALPDVPTVAESGFPGFEDVPWVGLFSPAKAPEAVPQRTNREVTRLQQAPDFLDKLAITGVGPLGGSVGAASAYLRGELDKWARVVRETGAQPN